MVLRSTGDSHFSNGPFHKMGKWLAWAPKSAPSRRVQRLVEDVAEKSRKGPYPLFEIFQEMGMVGRRLL